MGLKSTFKRFFELDEEEYVEKEKTEVALPQEREAETASRKDKPKQNVVSLQSAHKSTKVVLFEPKRYIDVQEIAEHLINHRSVVINIQRMNFEEAKRIVDFLSGIIYAIDGEIQKLGVHTFLCVPNNIDITGVISEVIDEEGQRR